jgi:DNA-binding response OmpR family regulator
MSNRIELAGQLEPQALEEIANGKSVRILLSDDDPIVQELICLILRDRGFELVTAENGSQALELWQGQSFDLIILDILMPILDGLKVCRIIRESSRVPIIMLTAKGDEQDIVNGFEAGADDYMVKPIRPKEFVARIQAILKRCEIRSSAPVEQLSYKDIHLDLRAQQIWLGRRMIRVSPIEFSLLQYLMEHKGEVVSKKELLHKVWRHTEISGDPNLVETAIKRLRRKLEDQPKNPTYIHTLWGIGYRFGNDHSNDQ